MADQASAPFLERLQERYQVTFFHNYVAPALEYVIRLGELLLLIVAFQVAAEQSESLAISFFAKFLMFSFGAYIGNISSLLFVVLEMKGIQSRAIRGVIATIVFVVTSLASLAIGRNVIEAVNSIVESSALL